MLFWSIKIMVISFIFIFLVHHLLSFFKSTLTVPKFKDLVNSPNEKYKHIYDIIAQSSPNTSIPEKYSMSDLIPTQKTEETNMKNELKNFLKKQIRQSEPEPESIYNSSGTNINDL